MKRVFSMMAMCVAFGMATAQTLKVADIEIKPGDKANVELEVDVNGVHYGAFQGNLRFPATGFSTTEKTTVASEWQNGTIAVGVLKEGKANIGGLSTSDSPMTNGVIGSFEIQAADDLAVGAYSVTIANFEFINGENDVKIADVAFTINVVKAYSVTLDENSTTAPEAAEGVNVTVKRTIAADTWSTIALPFAMSEAQVKEAFGSDVKLGDFNGYETTENEDGDVEAIVVKFESASAIEANHPYIIKVSSAISEFTVEGVDIDPDEATNAAVKRTKKDWSEMIGTYVTTGLDENTLFLNGGKFYYSAGNNTIKGFRAYFDFYDELANKEVEASRYFITFDDVTAIKTVKTTEGEEIYTLSGQRVKNAGKGVYIVNGKKVIKK